MTTVAQAEAYLARVLPKPRNEYAKTAFTKSADNPRRFDLTLGVSPEGGEWNLRTIAINMTESEARKTDQVVTAALLLAGLTIVA